jgi:hypothetical protein
MSHLDLLALPAQACPCDADAVFADNTFITRRPSYCMPKTLSNAALATAYGRNCRKVLDFLTWDDAELRIREIWETLPVDLTWVIAKPRIRSGWDQGARASRLPDGVRPPR